MPVAVIGATPSSGTAPLAVRFDASSSYDPVGAGLACNWYFGDGSSDSGNPTAHTYNAGGAYEVVLIVQDTAGLTATASGTVEVTAQPAVVEDYSSETDAGGTATFAVGEDSLTVTVMLPSASSSSASRVRGAGMEGLGVRVYGLGETLGIIVYDELGRYEPAIAVLGSGTETSSILAAAKATRAEVVGLFPMQSGGRGYSVVTRSEYLKAMTSLGYNKCTEWFPFPFSTSEDTVREALAFNMLRVAMRLDTDATHSDATTPYSLRIASPVAAELQLAGADQEAAVVGYGGAFLESLAQLLTPIWHKASTVEFSVGTSGGVPVPGSALLEGYSTAANVTILVTAGDSLTRRFQCSAPGSSLTYIQWGFGDGCTEQGQNVVHTYGRPGDYDVALTARDARGKQLHASGRVSIPYSCSTGQYNWQAAVQHARDWWDGFKKPPYENYSPYDCANFASQCLIEGGVDLSLKGDAVATGDGGTIRSSTFLARYLMDCLVGVEPDDRKEDEDDPDWFSPGDVAIFDANGTPEIWVDEREDWCKHAVFAVGYNKDGIVTCASHSKKHEGKTVDEFFALDNRWKYCTYYHIPDCLSYNSTPLPPASPTPLSPGRDAEPGETVDSLTPTLTWKGSEGASRYALAISVYPYGQENIKWRTDTLTGLQTRVPTGKLEYGRKYKWNMQAGDGARWSDVSTSLFFQTPQPPEPHSSTTTFVNSAGTSVSTYQATDSIYVKVVDGDHAGDSKLSSAVKLLSRLFDLTPLPGAASGTFTTRAISTAELGVSGRTSITATYTDPTDSSDSSSGTAVVAEPTPCTYSLSSYSQNYTDSGTHTASFTVNTGSDCPWTILVESTASPWLSAKASTSSGTGTVSYTVETNGTGSAQTGHIYVQDKTLTTVQTFTITQAGRATPVKELDHVVVSGPDTVNEDSSGSFTCTAYFNDTTSANVSAAATWTDDSPYAHTEGNKLVVEDVPQDSTCVVRADYKYNGISKWAFKAVILNDTATVLDRVEVTGLATVNENTSSQYTCTAYFSNGSAQVVTSSANWACASSSSWIALPGSVSISAGRLSVGSLDSDADITVTATYTSGATTKNKGISVHLHDTTPLPPPPEPCVYEVGPTTATRVPGSGGSGTICVRTTSGCQWTAETSDYWIHITTGRDYTGNGDVGYTVDPNRGAERPGTITAAGTTCTIPQAQSSSLPPVARLTMSAQGKTAHENGTLNLTMSSGQTIRVQLSAAQSSVDTSTPNAYWSIDGGLGTFECETYWDFSTAGIHTVQLFVTLSDGQTSASAQAQVIITTVP